MSGELKRRSGDDRRSGNERRSSSKQGLFGRLKNRRSGAERRSTEELRAGWVRISKFKSAFVGIPIN